MNYTKISEKTTLGNFLMTLKSDEIIAIGADKGTGYLYFGPAGDDKAIRKAFETYKSEMELKLTARKVTLKNYLINSAKEDAEEDELMCRAEAISATYRSIQFQTRYLDKYCPPMVRHVIDSYMKEVDSCRVIIIEGSEAGKYWFKDEYDNDHPADSLKKAV